MRGLVLIPVCAAALIVPVAVLASGGDGGFDGVVHAIEGRYHAHAARIPFLGLVSLVARKSTHGMAANLHVAEFEDFSAAVNGAELESMVEEKLGPEWERVVRETTRHGDEQTLVFMRPEGDRMGLFVVDKSSGDMDVVQVSVDPKHLDDDLAHYTHHHGGADGKDGGTD